MATEPITATNLANWIPEVWSKEVMGAIELNFVIAALFDRTFEAFVTEGGDKIVVPNLANISAAAVNTSIDMTLYDAVQNVTNINVNFKYDIGVAVDDINKLQSNPKYFEKVKSKLAYGLAKQIDVNCGAQFKTYSQQVGTVNVALTEDVFMSAYEYLNAANAPFDDRAWVIDPKSITDLLKLDYFVRTDYAPGANIHRTGFRGQWILGSPVYITTNLDTYAGGPHAAGYFQREATALVVQMQPKFEVARWPLRHSDILIGMCVFGLEEMRDTFGVCINTRA